MNVTLAAGLTSLLAVVSVTPAQVPDGWYVYGAFSPSRGPIGVFMSHPRTPGAPISVSNLQGDLTVTGSSCIVYRESDGAILVGERAPTGSSIDVHAIYLDGASVLLDASFSVGTGGPCCGEIPQMGLLPDDRVVLAVTDVAAGPLKRYETTSYGWQGVGILDTKSGLLTPINITNGRQIVDVFNGLAIAPDALAVYIGTYVSASRGEIWRVPIAGGAATPVAAVPAGLSNLAFDAAGDLWVATLDPSQGLFRVDVTSGAATLVPQTNGSLNAIAYEEASGNLAALSANAGNPVRSVFWMEPTGAEHLLTSPGAGTLSGIALHRNPQVFGDGSPGFSSYAWQMPNPGGLPVAGNASFGLSVQGTGTAAPGFVAIATAAAARPISVLGVTLHLDPASILLSTPLPFPGPMTLSLPLPNTPTLVGATLFVQSFHLESAIQIAATPAVRFSVM